VLQVWNGFCLAIMLLIRAMVADVADEVRLEQGRDRGALLYSLISSTQKVGGALAVSITFFLLALMGFNPAAHDAAKHTRGVVLVFMSDPTIFVVLGALVLWGYPLNAARHRAIIAELDAKAREAAPDARS